jgi:hypothetical protein
MKKIILLFSAISLIGALGAVHAADSRQPYGNYVSYFAGVELLATDKTLSPAQVSQRYRRLCMLTGIDGAKARTFAKEFTNDPTGWQKLRAAVLDLLQKRG